MTRAGITTVAKHIVPKGEEKHFAEWVRDIDAESRKFPGYQGMEVIHSHGETDLEHFCIFRFDNASNSDVWMKSDERRHWLADGRSFSPGTADIQSFKSLGFWFVSPENPEKGPKKHKVALATFLVIWPMVHYFSRFTSTYIQIPWIAEIVSVALIGILVTYIFMPMITRFLSGWLYR